MVDLTGDSEGLEWVLRPVACAMLGILDDALDKGLHAGLYAQRMNGRVKEVGLRPDQIRYRVVPVEAMPPQGQPEDDAARLEREVGTEDSVYHASIAEANRRHGRVAAIAMSAYWQGRYFELSRTRAVAS